LIFFLCVPLIQADLKETTLTLDPSSENQTMKMTRLLLSLSIAATGPMTALAQPNQHFSAGAAVRSLADIDEGELLEDEAMEGDSSNRYSNPALTVAAPLDFQMLAPTVVTTAAVSSPEYYGNSGVPSMSGWSSCAPAGAWDRGCGASRGWFSAETLLWFAADRYAPPLVMTAGAGINPLDGDVAFGDTFSSGVIPGFRVSGGMYLDSCQKFGVGARAFGTFNDTSRYSIASEDGSTSIGIPFFNPLLLPNPGPDAFLVAGQLPGGDQISGGIFTGSESFSMVGAEASAYILLSRGMSHRFDLVAGYTYNQLRNSLITEILSENVLTGDPIVDGTVFGFEDRFATENQFSGAHLGVLSSVVRKRVSLSTLAKVSFGNMRSRTAINGRGVTVVPGADPVDPPDIFVGDGFFGRGSNIGVYQSDRFAFLPEVGIKLGYAVRPNLELTFGYTLLMWSSVALAGDQIDTVIDSSGVSGRPTFRNVTSAYWMQSIDMGMNWTF
jgi:hypothetical protein